MDLVRRLQQRLPEATAVVLLVGSELEIWLTRDGNDGIVLAIGAVAWSLPFLAARRAPMATAVAVLAALVLTAALLSVGESFDMAFTLFAFAGAALLAGLSTDARRAVGGLAMVIAALAAMILLISEPAGFIAPAIVGGGVWLAAFLVSRRGEETRAARERAERLERERGERERLAVAEERMRIARELHDVVAHGVSVMVVQAGGVRSLLEPHQEREREALLAIERTGREALGEMRRVVGAMRRSDPELAIAPQAGLDQLDQLVEQMRGAGLPVTVEVEGEPADLTSGVDLAAYRIVQEGLTNTLKHAGPATAHVTLRYAPDALEVVVADDGRGAARGAAGGHGLIGMRERVAMFGGEIGAENRPGGGYVLRARLPLDRSAP